MLIHDHHYKPNLTAHVRCDWDNGGLPMHDRNGTKNLLLEKYVADDMHIRCACLNDTHSPFKQTYRSSTPIRLSINALKHAHR